MPFAISPLTSYLSNKNSIGGLFGKNSAQGYFAKIILVRDNTLNLAYNSIDNKKRALFDSMDEIINKFMLSEQSGFTEPK